MNRFLQFLRRHPIINLDVAAAFFLVTALFHDIVNNRIQDLIVRVGGDSNSRFATWNHLVTRIAVPVTAVLVVALAVVLWRQRRVALGVLWVVTLAMAAAAYTWLFSVNSEFIHFVQYAILAVLLFPRFGRLGETVAVCSLFGIVDEGWQYFGLHSNWGTYYDVNDVVFNAIGAGLGAMLVLTFAARTVADGSCRSARKFAPGYWAFSRAFIVLGVGVLAGKIAVHRPATGEKVWLALRRCGLPTSFWGNPSWGKPFHEMQVLEGVVIVIALVLLFVVVDRFAQRVDGAGGESQNIT